MSTKLDHSKKESPKMIQKSALLAISGGVDSIVLLNLLANRMLQNKETSTDKLQKLIQDFVKENNLYKLELAYIDHSQRPDTELDINAIKELSDKFNLDLHIVQLDLPENCSEQLAREQRYKALEKILDSRELDHIITAHHADDVVETAIINLTRGTGPRGISALRHQKGEGKGKIWRPFLYKLQEEVFITKRDILDYAKKEDLHWHEDSTNKSDKYLRNRVRTNLKLQGDSKLSKEKLAMLKLIAKNISNTEEIDQGTYQTEQSLMVNMADQEEVYSINLFKQLPEEVKDQFLHKKISQLGYDVSKDAVARAKEFIQTKTTGKTLQLKGCEIKIPEKGTFEFISLPKEKTN